MTLYTTLLWGVIIVLALLSARLFYLSKRGARVLASSDELRGRLAQAVTTWALIAIALLGIAIIAIAGYNVSIPSTDVEARREFLDAAKYVFASTLPVVAAWVGTVMAFYFGKENFKAATDSVSQIARQLTSQEKLGQTNVQEIGKAMETVAPLRFDENDKLETVTLDKLEEKMRAKEPPFERLPILSAQGAPLMLVHRSVLNDFLLNKKTADPGKNAKDYNLSDLAKDYPWLQQNSFATVSPTASAAQAKDAMAQKKGCSDIFVTMDGTSAAAVTRWITNVDLLQAAQV
jgi:hypothetical protein